MKEDRKAANGDRLSTDELKGIGRREGKEAQAGNSEQTILLPEREPNSVAHIATPHLADPDQAKDFEMQVSTE